jgi:anaerobic magnesium-protoporphyrin IX monomethyl ester cyclase
MNILIVVPRYKPAVGDFYDFPLGLAYISAILKHNGFSVHVLNLNHVAGSLGDLITDWIEHNDIDVLCIGGLCVHYPHIREILTHAKTAKPGIITIAGGGLITAEPELMIENLPLDFGIIGEGETTIIQIAQALDAGSDPADIPGVIYSRNNTIVKTSERAVIDDLGQIPFPDYDGFGIDFYLDHQLPSDGYYMYPYDKPRMLPIISSRSCPYNCTFCFHPLGQKYRRRPLDNFFDELHLLIDKYRINLLAVIDETLAASKGRVKDFCQLIKSCNIKWMTQLRVTAVDEEILEMLKDAGCYYISYGIESACNEILKSMKKFITLSDIEKALELTQKYQIGIQGNFLFSDREETFETVCRTVDWWLKHPQYHIHLNTLVPYPGSDDYQYCIKKGIILNRLKYIEDGCPVFNFSRMTAQEYTKVYSFLYDTRINAKYLHLAEVLAVEQAGISPVRCCELVTLTFRCCQCGQINTYRNYGGTINNFFKIACRHCNQRSDISPEKFPHFARTMRGNLTANQPEEVKV